MLPSLARWALKQIQRFRASHHLCICSVHVRVWCNCSWQAKLSWIQILASHSTRCTCSNNQLLLMLCEWKANVFCGSCLIVFSNSSGLFEWHLAYFTWLPFWSAFSFSRSTTHFYVWVSIKVRYCIRGKNKSKTSQFNFLKVPLNGIFK